jgi:uncharacterized protein involved in exopolysaccharide biosynthesis
MLLLLRWAILLPLLAATACFILFALTSQPRYKRLGLVILKWTVFGALGFFAVLIVQEFV